MVFEQVAWFEKATFEAVAGFETAVFQSVAWFEEATFVAVARFTSAVFQGVAGFERVSFRGRAEFSSAAFHSGAGFRSADFGRVAGFEQAVFRGVAGFEQAVFQDLARFQHAGFHDRARFGHATFRADARFGSVVFAGVARFEHATFRTNAWFEQAGFHDTAVFESTAFRRMAVFESAVFHDAADFSSTTFQDTADFSAAAFERIAGFESSTFQGTAEFSSAVFQRTAGFESAIFERDAQFEQAVFEAATSLGPLVCAGQMTLSEAVFSGPVTLMLATRRLACRRTRWSSTAELRLRHATVDFAHAVFEHPLTIAAEADPFVLPDGQAVAEEALADTPDARTRVNSLRGVDAAHLVLADVDLSGCLFTGTVHLDQLRLEGTCTFAEVPPGTHWRRLRPVRFTQRRTLAEEHHWRAGQPSAVRGWRSAGPGATGHVTPAQLAPVYRSLRKAVEDAKNEPGAADFYYGEMEMRRHDRTGTGPAERRLLHCYWLLSGYGLRASRALGWLAAAMLVTVVLLMGFGVPRDSPEQKATGTVPPGGGRVTFEMTKGDPQNPTGNRFTGERFEQALNVTLNSVVFRSSGQDLTTAGTYIEMASRLLEPTLLALAVLALRGRIKR
ncbi:hypothetical protein GCM10020295_78670 [Streptomyces cinereospinus]